MPKAKSQGKKASASSKIKLAPTSYQKIVDYCKKLHSRLKPPNPKPLGLTDFPLIIKMSIDPSSPNDGLGQFIAGNYKKIVAVMGIDDTNNFTISFLAVDNVTGKIVKGQGQETWPTINITRFSDSPNDSPLQP